MRPRRPAWRRSGHVRRRRPPLHDLGGLGAITAVSSGRAARPEAASSVAPTLRVLATRTLPASLPRNDHRTPTTSDIPPNPPTRRDEVGPLSALTLAGAWHRSDAGSIERVRARRIHHLGVAVRRSRGGVRHLHAALRCGARAPRDARGAGRRGDRDQGRREPRGAARRARRGHAGRPLPDQARAGHASRRLLGRRRLRRARATSLRRARS